MIREEEVLYNWHDFEAKLIWTRVWRRHCPQVEPIYAAGDAVKMAFVRAPGELDSWCVITAHRWHSLCRYLGGDRLYLSWQPATLSSSFED